MTRLLIVFVTAFAGAIALAAPGVAREGAATFACPKDPSTQPIGKSYGATRGATYCNDGATATAIVVGGKPEPDIRGGVCWRDKSRTTYVNIGTEIPGKRRATDPPGFSLSDVKPGGFLKDTASVHRRTTAWSGAVKITWNSDRKSGKWSGKSPKLVGGKLTYVQASGKFACKRFLEVPL